MRPSHRMDDIFRQKLHDYAEEAPMHLWDKIDARRTWQHRLGLLWSRYRGIGLLGTLLLATLMTLQLSQSRQGVKLDSFPVPIKMAQLDFGDPAPDQTLDISPTVVAVKKKSPDSKPRLEAINPLPVTSLQELDHPVIRVFSAPRSQHNATASLPTVLDSWGDQKHDAFPDKVICASFGSDRWDFYVDALFSPDLAIRNLKAKSQRDLHYVDTRNATETTQFSYSLALRAGVRSPIGVTLASGVNYSQVNEKFDFVDEDSKTITITSIYNAEGELVRTDTVESVHTVDVGSHNNYRMIDIPLLLGYEHRMGRWTYGIQGGTYINLLFAPKGDFLSPEMEPVTFTPGADGSYQAFRDRIGFGWYGSFSVGYHLTPKLRLLVEPHIKGYPQPATVDGYEAEQRYTSIGLFMGLRHTL